MSTLTKVLERNIKVIENERRSDRRKIPAWTSSDAAGRMAQ